MPRPSPIVLVLIGIASVQLGAGVAKSLFDEVSPSALVFLRLATSSLVLLVWARPRLRGRSRTDLLVLLGFGASLGLMNLAIYESFSRIPLGIAVTLEFVGPLTLAVVGSRRARDLAWVGLAAVGVALLGAERADLDLLGLLFALLAGACWAAYILLSGATGRRFAGIEGLALASVVAMLLVSPFLLLDGATDGMLDSRVLLLGAAVGVLSSVVPYTCELVALRTLRPATFGILMSLEPAAAALAGILVLSETLSGLQWLAIACVVAASIGATRQGVVTDPVPD
ncbi:EamA family transporter [Nocardioides plantarum]|uniref:DMT family transporter n=1 Tax=Nocardioides plantarum TaxID=29299 RepID=A0ABV5K607_9ACTN|nr:EamA family transporter [Nocardioides plantarum]